MWQSANPNCSCRRYLGDTIEPVVVTPAVNDPTQTYTIPFAHAKTSDIRSTSVAPSASNVGKPLGGFAALIAKFKQNPSFPIYIGVAVTALVIVLSSGNSSGRKS